MELESKFIEGTNNQYSIRNDGVVISHWRENYDINLKRNIIIYKDKVLNPSLNKLTNIVHLHIKIGEKRNRNSYLKKIVADTFKLPNPYVNIGSAITIAHKDNNPLNCSLDNLYYKGRGSVILATSIEEKKEIRRQRNLGYKKKSYENLSLEKRIHRKDYAKKWLKENPEKAKEIQKKTNARVIQDLDKSYIAAKLKLPISLLTENLYQSQKAIIMNKRLLAQKLNCSITLFNK
jgi:hypothetical protein